MKKILFLMFALACFNTIKAQDCEQSYTEKSDGVNVKITFNPREKTIKVVKGTVQLFTTKYKDAIIDPRGRIGFVFTNGAAPFPDEDMWSKQQYFVMDYGSTYCNEPSMFNVGHDFLPVDNETFFKFMKTLKRAIKDAAIASGMETVSNTEETASTSTSYSNTNGTSTSTSSRSNGTVEVRNPNRSNTSSTKESETDRIERMANEGDLQSILTLARKYERGDGMQQSLTEALKWYTKAAELGDKNAQCYVGNAYYAGQGCQQSYAEACKWYKKAADQGVLDAQVNLAECYYYGNGVTKDYKEAVKYYTLAAEQGNPGAMFSLGWCYENGEGVRKNLSEAKKWYKKAMDSGFSDAKESYDRVVSAM